MPKGVPLEPGQRALAVHVEDHPLDYATFEGEIPKGQYGAGTVEIWDRGTYELVEEKKDGGLTVRLHGKRLRGHVDARARRSSTAIRRTGCILRKRDDGRRGAGRRRAAATSRCSRRSRARGVADGRRLAVRGQVGRLPRARLRPRRRGRRLVSRNGNDLTERFPNVAKEVAKAVKTPDCVLDGEVCALDEHGRPSFSAMQQGKPGTPIVYEVFDLLEVEGEPLVDLPLRRAARAAGGAARPPQPRPSGSRRRSRTATRCTTRRRSRGSRGSSPSAPTRRTGRASARASG